MGDHLLDLRQIFSQSSDSTRAVELASDESIAVYPLSILFEGQCAYFIATQRGQKYFWIAGGEGDSRRNFVGEALVSASNAMLFRCHLNHQNASALRDKFAFTRPTLIGLADSFGFGDRLGIANPAHLRSVRGSGFKPVLAQQSIRELERTERQPEEVMDAATWACMQEGYTEGFGADADHLKTTQDIDRLVQAGFTMFTLDPGEHVVNDADVLPIAEIEQRVSDSLSERLGESLDEFNARYVGKTVDIRDDFYLKPGSEQVLRALLKYGGVIAHTEKLYRYLKNTYPNHASEVELSVDETEAVTSAFEHYLVVKELQRRGVELVSLAPRFVGDFEKGIDYKGDLKHFEREYLKHLWIAEKLGPYKISFHSGSDKFQVYEAVGALAQGHVHVKTAGTSYLEALRTVAVCEPNLFREVLDFSRQHFEAEKRTYHVSAVLDRVPGAADVTDAALPELLDQDDSRQVLHVTFGKVLTTRDASGDFLFRERVLACLRGNEDVHYQYLRQHFDRHLQPFRRT